MRQVSSVLASGLQHEIKLEILKLPGKRYFVDVRIDLSFVAFVEMGEAVSSKALYFPELPYRTYSLSVFHLEGEKGLCVFVCSFLHYEEVSQGEGVEEGVVHSFINSLIIKCYEIGKCIVVLIKETVYLLDARVCCFLRAV